MFSDINIKIMSFIYCTICKVTQMLSEKLNVKETIFHRIMFSNIVFYLNRYSTWI